MEVPRSRSVHPPVACVPLVFIGLLLHSGSWRGGVQGRLQTRGWGGCGCLHHRSPGGRGCFCWGPVVTGEANVLPGQALWRDPSQGPTCRSVTVIQVYAPTSNAEEAEVERFYSGWQEKAMAPHSSTLAWKNPWMEEPGRLQSMRSLRVGHD